MKQKIEQDLLAQGVKRLADKVTPIYKCVVFHIKLKTGELIHAIKVNEEYYELEREELTELENGQILTQCYISSYALPKQLLSAYRLHGGLRYSHPIYECTLENAATYSQDPSGSPIEFGSHPYYLILIRN